jgi:PIN domain nuclease of toxin-antitoxin system
MKVLLDTHFVLWAAKGTVPADYAGYFDAGHELYFSAANIWEIVIKNNAREDFSVDVGELVADLAVSGYRPLPITVRHTMAVASLPDIHKDPFDRILVAQSLCEKMPLLTVDGKIKRYNLEICPKLP